MYSLATLEHKQTKFAILIHEPQLTLDTCIFSREKKHQPDKQTQHHNTQTALANKNPILWFLNLDYSIKILGMKKTIGQSISIL